MPYKDEKLFWRVRVKRSRKAEAQKLAKQLGFSDIGMMTQAVDMWLEHYKSPVK